MRMRITFLAALLALSGGALTSAADPVPPKPTTPPPSGDAPPRPLSDPETH